MQSSGGQKKKVTFLISLVRAPINYSLGKLQCVKICESLKSVLYFISINTETKPDIFLANFGLKRSG